VRTKVLEYSWIDKAGANISTGALERHLQRRDSMLLFEMPSMQVTFLDHATLPMGKKSHGEMANL
jgi:hypothetical protein